MLYSVSKYNTLSHEFINTYVSDYDIYAYYLNGNFKINEVFNSPFHKDTHPSFGIYDIGNGKLLYKDFAKGLNGNAIQFVQELFNLPDFKSALIQIYVDLIISKQKLPVNDIKINKEYKQRQADLGVQRQSWNKEDAVYWNQFNIDQNTLEKFEVSPIKYLFSGPYIKHEYTKEELMYVYKVYDKVKIYRPLSNKCCKWYGSLTRNYIHGYKQLPEQGDLLIITKSLKDVMCLHTLGYTAISPSSEGTLVPEHIIKHLKKRFKHIIVFYDNDEPGMKYAQRMCKRYDLPSKFIPLELKEKDTTDFYKTYGKEQTEEMLKTLFQEFLVSEKETDEKKEKESNL